MIFAIRMCLTLIWIAKRQNIMWIFVIIVAYIEHFIEQFKRNNLLFLYKDVSAAVCVFDPGSLVTDY